MVNVKCFIPLIPIPVPWSREPMMVISQEFLPENAKLSVDQAQNSIVVQVGENIVIIPINACVLWGTESSIVRAEH